MLKTKLRTFIVLTALVAMTLGLAGCRKQDKTPPPTPPAAQQKAPNQQSSPLPTPNAATSPIKK